jgi:hypothetical protein
MAGMPPIEDPENCILQICCDVTRAHNALAMRLSTELKLNDKQAADVADWINANYDLAPHGMVQPLFQYIAALARQYPYQG